MKLTAQEEYGLRCLLQLAHEPMGQTLTVNEISRREGLSGAYVAKLLRILNHAGLTQSMRGIKGGYRLSRAADAISVGEVMRGLAGGVLTSNVICHTFTGNRKECVHMDNCGLRPVWNTIAQFVQGVLDHTPVSSLLHSEQQVAAVIWRSSTPGGAEPNATEV